jgi:TRAP-type C4-dicarboxylate transport system permease small subunit
MPINKQILKFILGLALFGTITSVSAQSTFKPILVLAIIPVPEPATLAFAGLGTLGCVLLFWRRKS